LSLFFAVAFCLTLKGQGQRPVWKGEIVVEKGVKVVKNPREPLHGEFSFDLQEELAIGGDPERGDYYFPRGGSLSIDGDGNFYVTDTGNKRVQMYDESGKYVRTIGRQGQGPGEYVFPGQVHFDPEGNVCVRNGGIQLNIYGKDGVFKKKVTFKTFVNAFILGPKGTVIGTKQPGFEPGGPKHSLIQLDRDGLDLRTIAEFRGELSEGQKAVTLHWYSSLILFSPVTPETFCYGFPEEFKIYVADSEGRTLHIITNDEKPQSISGSEKDETRKSGMFMWFGQSQKPEDAIVFPDHRPLFRNLMSDDAARLYVVRFNSILEKDAPPSVDVFSKDGIYLYKMTWPFIPAAIKHGCMYEVRSDKETGEVTIVRHRIKNWAQMATDGD
jgi:hypothetical protein